MPARRPRSSKKPRTELRYIYEFDYRPKVTGTSRSKCMAFLGSFRYDPEAESVFHFTQ